MFLFSIVFRVLTINIRGLSSAKLDLVVDNITRSDMDVCFIQETQISYDNVIRSLSSRWRGSSFWSLAFGRQGGVAVLFSDQFLGEIKQWKKDSEGRVISVQVCFGNANYNFVNIYAPTNRLGLDQTSNLSCVESNTYLGRPKLIKFDVDSDVELNVSN